MNSRTQELKNKVLSYDEPEKRLSVLKDAYKGETAYIIAGGPSLKNYSNEYLKEALKDKIHDIHNFLRNNGAGYGMNALKVFNILFGLKKIEEKGLIDKVELKRPECEFSYLLKLANENNDTSNEKLASTIFKEVIDGINDSKITDLLFYEIPKNIKGKVFSYLIKEIDNITKIEKDCNILLSGKIYEYFIGRDESAISELGAYFTDRHIVDYILKKLDPNITENGSVPSMIDMFGGSGGFTTGYINFLQEKYDNIDWSKGINKIHHYDMNEDVIKSAGLEIFCLTGELPNMNNLKYKNSFTDDFDNKKYVYPITNPPYGGDKNKKSVLQEKNDKIKEYIKKDLLTITDEGILIARQKQLKAIEAFEKSEKKESDKSRVSVANCSHRINKFAIDNNLTGNDKESCSLMLLMDIVKVGGTAIGVLKEGVFFNKTYKNIRKCLIENYNVREVISVPSDQFENTTTKTSILIFDNTEKKTEEVKFSDLTVERYQSDVFVEMNGLIVITETKDDISGVSDKLTSIASKDDILSNPICSLNGKDYNKKVIVCGEGYELVRLGDICENQNGNAFKTNEYVNSGIPLITITHIKNEMIIFNNNHYINENEKYSKFEIKNLDIVITLTGKKPNLCSIGIKHGGKKQYLNQRCAILRNFKKINHYYFMAMFNSYLSQYINSYIGNGSNQDNISLNEILNLQIPIPKSEDKILEWINKISKPYDDKTSKKNKIKDLEEFIQNKIKDITDNEDCLLPDNAQPLLNKIKGENLNGYLSSILQSVCAIDSLSSAFQIRDKLKIGQSIVTKDGFWLGKNWLRINSNKDLTKGVLRRKKELEFLEIELTSCRNHTSKIEQQKNSTEKKLRELEAQREKDRSSLTLKQNQYAELRSQANTIQIQLEHLTARQKRINDELKETCDQKKIEQEKLLDARRQLESATFGIEKNSKEREELLADRNKKMTNLEDARKLFDKHKDNAHEIAMRERAATTKLQSTLEGITRLESQATRLNERRQQLQDSFCQDDSPNEDLKKELATQLNLRLQIEKELMLLVFFSFYSP